MPEHILLRISESAKGTPSTIMQVLKQRVSRRLRRKPLAPTRELILRFQTSDHLLPTFRQPRLYDFNVWSQKKFVEKLQYVHMNRREEESCGSSPGLALEQFFLLREQRFGIGPHRSHALILVTRFTSKAPAFKKPKTGAPKIPSRRSGHPPPYNGTTRTLGMKSHVSQNEKR
jgi:hypothetical protein